MRITSNKAAGQFRENRAAVALCNKKLLLETTGLLQAAL